MNVWCVHCAEAVSVCGAMDVININKGAASRKSDDRRPSMGVFGVLLSLGAVGFLLLLHLCKAGSLLRRSLRPLQGLSQAELQNLPCFEFEVGGSSCTDSSCAICLEEFERSGGEKCKAVPTCNHTFHAKCLDTWLSKAPRCPICRTLVGDRRESGQSCIAVHLSCNRSIQHQDAFSIPMCCM